MKEKFEDSYHGKIYKNLRLGSILLMGTVLFVLLLLFFINTVVVRRNLYQETVIYVTDMSKQVAENISYRLNGKIVYIEEMADSLGRMPEFVRTEEYLNKRGAAMDLEEIFVLDQSGGVFPEKFDCEEIQEWRTQSEDLFEKPMISYIPNDRILFSAPILSDGENRQVLVGAKGYAGIQELLTAANFDGRGECLIIDRDGTVIAASEGGRIADFNAVKKQVDLGSNPDAALVAEKIASGYEGTIPIDSFFGEPSLVALRTLNTDGWMLLSIVPQDLLIRQNARTVWYYLLLFAGGTAVSAAVLYGMAKSRSRVLGKIENMAFRDPLTGGMNNYAFQMECDQRLKQNPNRKYGMIFLNIRNFKRINENWGVEEGNKTLIYVYHTLKDNIREEELLTRSEVDHFFLFLSGESQEEFAERTGKLLEKVDSFGHENKHAYHLEIAAGCYVIGDTGEGIRIYQDRARRASKVRENSGEVGFYDEEMIRQMNRENKLDELFEDSLNHHDFQIYLQPKVFIQKECPAAAEALIRWLHPKEGMIYPSEFIPQFEKNGKICELDFYVFEEVCRMLDRRRKENKELIKVSVNLSRAHMRDVSKDFLHRLIEMKEKYRIPDGIIELELTESMMFENAQIPLIKDIIHRIRTSGFSCSLDDFGFGYSSLALLKELDVSAIKLDRQFFLDENEKTWKVVASFIRLAHELDMEVVAEGIELTEQVEILRAIGCDMIQGYVYAKPLPMAEFEAWQEKNRKGDRG